MTFSEFTCLSIKEATKGYFHDMNMTRRHGGKTWIAPNVLIREDVCNLAFLLGLLTDVVPQKSLYLPNISGKSLLDKEVKNTTEICYGKVTLLAMLSTQISEVWHRSSDSHSCMLTETSRYIQKLSLRQH